MSSKLINPKYKFPDYFQWPFFFTLQTNGEVRRKQIHMWIDLVLKFCQDNKVWKLTPALFAQNMGQNPKINRKLDPKDIEIIFQSLVSVKKAVFVNPAKPQDIYILWKSFNEWEQYLYNSAMNRQSIDKLETLDYIIEDDDNKNEEYYNMDKNLLINVLKGLESKGKCGLVKDSSGENYIAVKFIREEFKILNVYYNQKK